MNTGPTRTHQEDCRSLAFANSLENYAVTQRAVVSRQRTTPILADAVMAAWPHGRMAAWLQDPAEHFRLIA
jgi:hypothetical protein